jgi:DNA-binding CsgD family transcriptional regulator
VRELGADEAASPDERTDETVARAARLVKPSGIVVQVGEASGTLQFALGRVPHEPSFTASMWGSLNDTTTVLELASRGIFEWLGARLWFERARSELRRIGGRISSNNELSETERRIVELVVAGRKNRDGAVELSLSPNTVAWNLSKIYRKLGVNSRTELAALAANSRL